MARINKILDIINVTLLSIASVSLVVTALSVMNTIMIVVRDGIGETDILKAIGATRSHVLAVFLGGSPYSKPYRWRTPLRGLPTSGSPR